MKVVRGKKALVTGTASGIGHGRLPPSAAAGISSSSPRSPELGGGSRGSLWIFADWIAREGWRSKGRLTITQR
jgi:hypothetical protein